jgi:agmatinase
MYPPQWQSETSAFTHGSMFWIASKEGLILNGSSVHAGLRTRLSGADWDDYVNDDAQGFFRLSSDDIDLLGPQGIVDAILGCIGVDVPVYLSIDIDVVDPGLAPGTGTPEPGGWTTREMIRILRGIEELNIVGADIVEVSPPYDDRGESTALAAAQFVYEIITSIVKRGLGEQERVGQSEKSEL